MQYLQSSQNGAQSYYDSKREQSLAAYEQQRGLPAKENFLTRLFQRISQRVGRSAREPELTWQRKSTQSALES